MAEKIIGIGVRDKPLHPRRCETCRHFDPPEGAMETGACTANFPFAVFTPAGVVTFSPQMKPTQRCGKWESKDTGDNNPMLPA